MSSNINFSIKKVCEYIFDSEEDDFLQTINNYKSEGKINTLECELIKAFVERGDINPPEEVKIALRKVNHVYAHAALSYSECYQ